jgi:hypothetical protein
VNPIKFQLTLGVVLCAWLGPAGPAAAQGNDPKGPVWETDYAAALKAAKAQGKPIFAVFR